MLHVDPGFPMVLGKNVSIGHKVMLHGCTIGEGTLIGINSVVMNGAKIGKAVLSARTTLITEGKEIPDGVLVVGSPGQGGARAEAGGARLPAEDRQRLRRALAPVPARDEADYFGAIRIAPSRRIVSPLSISFSTIVLHQLRVLRRACRGGAGTAPACRATPAPPCGSAASIGVLEDAGRDRHDADAVARQVARDRQRHADDRRPWTPNRRPGRSGRRRRRPTRC